MTEKQGFELLKENTELKSELLFLKQEMAQLKRMIYGSKSERFVPSEIPGQLSLDIAPEENQAIKSTEEQIKIDAYDRKVTSDQKMHPVRQGFPENLRREIIIIQPKEDLSGYKKMGEEQTEVLEYTEPKFFVKRFVREKYVNEDTGKIIIGELPTRAIDKSMFGENLIAQIITDKYVDHLPLYRQIERFKRSGMTLSSSTLNDTVKNSCNLLKPLYQHLRDEVLADDYLQVDETPIKVLDPATKGKTHRGYHWVYHAVKKQLILFDYRPGRGREGPEELLKNFSGYLQTDGYQVYDAFAKRKDIILLGCMAHVRRKFDEAKLNDLNLSENALLLIQRLYIVEKTIREHSSITDEEILQLRKEMSLPALNDFESWLKMHLTDTLPKSAIGQAIQYAMPRIEKLRRFTEQPYLQIDNNLVENAIRPVAIGRKNYLFAGSHEGAERAAMIYSFFGTCKLNNVNPQKWLADVLVKINDTKTSELSSLLPANWKKTNT
jgi:transposase